MDMNSLAHTTWECKYHIVFAPKFRRKVIYQKLRADIGKILSDLCKRKGIEIIAAEACPDHVHMFVRIPPEYALVQSLYHYGFRVPEDIIVVSCDAGSDSEGHVILLTTIASDSEYVGEAAFIQLYELINGHEAKPGLRERENQLIFGMSCGCGNSRIGNIRMKIEREERKKEADIQYSNSRMEEKLYTIKDFSEFVYFIRNLTYLIVDMEKVSMSLVDEDFQKADCVFLTDYLETGGRVNFDATDIFPPLFQDRERLNTYVLPMVFDEVTNYKQSRDF